MNFDRLTAYLDSLTPQTLPGCTCSIMKNHELLYQHSSGYADLENKVPHTGNELYYMWSATKPITCVTAMSLYEQGCFLLTDPVKEYAPEFASLFVRDVDDCGNKVIRPAKSELRIVDLMTMCGGYNYDFPKREVIELIEREHAGATASDLLPAFAAQPLCHDPGVIWEYSICLDVLGGVLERITGKRLGQLAKEAVFDPLGMIDTAYGEPVDEERKSRIAKQYCFSGEKRNCHPTNADGRYDNQTYRIVKGCDHMLTPDFDSGGAGIVSSAHDYAIFCDAMACGGIGKNGNRILSPETVSLMAENWLTPEQQVGENWQQLAGYGYGLGVRTLVNRTLSGSLSPIGEFGWMGAAGAYMMIDPVNSLSLFYTPHLLNNPEPYIIPHLRNLCYAGLSR